MKLCFKFTDLLTTGSSAVNVCCTRVQTADKNIHNIHHKIWVHQLTVCDMEKLKYSSKQIHQDYINFKLLLQAKIRVLYSLYHFL